MRILRVFYIIIITLSELMFSIAHAQKIHFEVELNYEKIAARTDIRVMENLKNYINNFINSKVWVKTNYDEKSEITGNLLITLDETANNSIYSGFLTLQAQRLIYNTSYYSTLINFKDNDIKFEFGINQIDNFDENNFIISSNPMQMNLPAILSFYIYLVLGLDANSFGLYRGNSFLNTAFQIANNAATNSEIAKGWTPFENISNRYMLIRELTSESHKNLHTAFYSFFRDGLDKLYTSKSEGADGVVKSLNDLTQLKETQGYSLNLFLFINSHKPEIQQILNYIEDNKAKNKALQQLKKLI